MNLHILFFGALAGFGLLQWWVLPQAEAAWAANRTAEKLAKAGLVAALKAGRTILQIATLVYGTLLAGAWLLDAIGDPVTAATLRAKINYLEQLKEPLAYIKDNVAANVTFWCALLGLAYPIYKRHRADLAAQVTTRVQSEFERLKGELDRGEWADLPPTEEMARIREQLERLRGYATQAEGQERDRAGEIIEVLERRWIEADFVRRMNLADEPAPEPSLARRLWPRLVALVTSRGFTRDSGLLAKTCSYAGMAITCVSLVGIVGSNLDTNLAARIAHAWDLAWSPTRRRPKPAG